jgi:hypothetical protein
MKHHYVPVFYQKHFAASDGLLWVYDRLLKTCNPRHPLSTCCQHDLYAFKTEGCASNQIIETEFLRDIDGSASSALKRLTSDLANPSPELLGEIVYFAALQHVRVPANKQMISMFYEAGANDFMEVAFANVERATAMIRKYEAETGEKSEVAPESMVEATTSGSIKAVVNEAPFIQSIVKHTEFIANGFTEMDVKILISPPQTGFILSDNPVTMVPPPGLRVAGFRSPGSFTFLPLTRSLCLRIGQPGSGRGPKIIDRETVRFINENTATNSYRFVMGPHKIQIESVVRRSGSTEMDGRPRWITTKRVDGNGDTSRALIAQPRQLRYLEL